MSNNNDSSFFKLSLQNITKYIVKLNQELCKLTVKPPSVGANSILYPYIVESLGKSCK